MSKAPVVATSCLAVMLGMSKMCRSEAGCAKLAEREGVQLIHGGEVAERAVFAGAAASEGWRAAGAAERAELGAAPLGTAVRELEPAEQAVLSPPLGLHATLPETAPDPDELAQGVLDDLAAHRGAAVVAKLEELAARGEALSPGVRARLVASVATESAPVAHRLEAALATGDALSDATTHVIAEHGQLVLVRDVVQLPRARVVALKRPATAVIYVDTRLLIGREGLPPIPGAQLAQWLHLPGVRIDELRRDAIGALPDRIVERATGVQLQHAAGALPEDAKLGSRAAVYVIRLCATGGLNGRDDAC